MDTTDFSILVGRLERESDDSPGRYSAKVALVAALGYGVIAAMIGAIGFAGYFVIASLLAGERPRFFAIAGFIGALATLLAIIRALWVRVDAPEGRRIEREEAPALFAALDEVLQKMAVRKKGRIDAVAIDAVTVNHEFNAGICQLPRWGIFGNYRNHLQIGVPLLAALSVAEFKTMLAHEIGHLSSAHGKFSAWIYRQRITWHSLQQKFADPQNVFDRLLATFYGWYAPYFRAYTFVLARNHEYAADRAAAEATHARVLGRALTKLDLLGRFLGEVFWKRLYDQVEKLPEPRYLPYSMMPRAFAAAQKEWLREEWLQESLRRFAAEDDTHPGLSERLAALGVQPELPTQVAGKSALALLGTDESAWLKWCDEEWAQENVPVWRKRHDAIREARWKIAQYDNTAAADLKPEHLWEKATLQLNIGEETAAMDTLAALIARENRFAKAHFVLGRLLLDYGDESGLNHLTLAAQLDEEFVMPAGEVGYGYLSDRGRKGEAHRFWDRIRPG